MNVGSKTVPHSRIPSLDGFRAVSIMMVLFSHSEATVGFPQFVSRHQIFPFAVLGVRIFFVISGFLITTLLVKEEQTRGVISLSAFYKRRLLRILPAYYFYILVLFTLGLFATFLRCPLSTYFSAATFTTRLWGYWGGAEGFDKSWPLIHTWSLSVEEQYYLLWPTLLVFLPPGSGRRRIAAAFIIGLVLLARILFVHYGIFNTKLMIHNLFITQADSIMFGCLLALALGSYPLLMKRIFDFYPHLLRAVAVGLIYTPYFLLSYLINHSTRPFHHSLEAFIPSIQAVAVTYLIGSYIYVKSGLTYRILNHPLIQWIGILSYSLYLWQQLFLAPQGIYPIYWFQMFPQNLALAFVSCLISYYLIEKPFLAMKSRFSRLQTTKLASR